MHIIRRHFLVCGRGPILPMASFVDHVDHAAPRAPGRWTTARPRKGTMRSRGRRSSGCPHVEEYEGSLVHCGVRLPSLQNNRGCG